jgi:hypothetical protein
VRDGLAMIEPVLLIVIHRSQRVAPTCATL